tara:strand:- start:116 stop:223 length:108 start_codon:yes stop_codon:yes gene_type:complete
MLPWLMNNTQVAMAKINDIIRNLEKQIPIVSSKLE